MSSTQKTTKGVREAPTASGNAMATPYLAIALKAAQKGEWLKARLNAETAAAYARVAHQEQGIFHD